MVKNLMNKLNNKKNKKGFTLIELIIVIAIIAILAALLLPKLGNVKENANKTSDITSAKQIGEAALSLYADDKISAATYTIGSATTIDNYLQTTPKIKAKSVGHAANAVYTVTIGSDGSVSVKAGTLNLYPTVDSAYDHD